MSAYQPGEIVDITIRGARVGHLAANGFLNVFVDGVPLTVDLVDAVTVERRAPAEWPPRPGDLWRDRNGDLWFAFRDHEIFLIPSYPTTASVDGRPPDDVMQKVGPLTLVHRDDEQDGAER